MILSVSRRTDVPAFFHRWFLGRIREGFALVRNPMNAGQVGRVTLTADTVDCIVFWTKNPAPMLADLGALDGWPCYFQFTLTPYGHDIEPGLPDKAKVIDTFRRLADRLGPERVIWRYDPILVSAGHTADFHAENFAAMAGALRGYTKKAVVSFVEPYPKTRRSLAAHGIRPPDPEAKRDIAARLSAAARGNFLALEACAQDIDLSHHGIGPARCIDADLASRIAGWPLEIGRDKSQRPHCGCAASIDIGAYDTCPHGCLYCYANHSRAAALENLQNHDAASPILSGIPPDAADISERPAGTGRRTQGELFG